MTTKATRALKVAQLKRKARQHYEGYHYELDTYTCGAALAETINPRLAEHKQEFNKIMDELSVLDPQAPNFRL